MIKLLFVFLFFCSAYSSVIADDVLKRVYELDSFETPVSITVVESLVKPGDKSNVVGHEDRDLGQIDLREPAQLFLPQSNPFTPVVRKSDGHDPGLRFRFPRAWSELRRQMSESVERDRLQDRRKVQKLLYGGAFILERVDKDQL